MGDVLLYAILIFATFRFLEFLLTFIANCRQRYELPDVTWLPATPVPEDFVPEFPGLFSDLEKLGFVVDHFRRETSMNRGGRERLFGVFWHPQQSVWALAESLTSISVPVSRGMLRLETIFADDFSLTTVANMEHFFVGYFPQTESRDVGPVSPTEQFQQHAARVPELIAEHGNPKGYATQEELQRRWHERYRAYLDAGLGDGTFVRVKGGEFRLSIMGAAKVSIRLLSGMRAVRNRRAQMSTRTESTGKLLIADDVHGYRAWKLDRERSRASQAKGQAKTLLVVSGLLFLLSMSGEGGGLSYALLLLLVVFFHEMGHIWAMRLVGYKDTQILFIPFLGALAMSREHLRTSPWQRVLVLLMGPLPGMIIAWLLLSIGIVSGDGMVTSLVSLLLVVNYANLLPLVPLDGGRVLAEALAGLGVIFPILFQLVGLGALALLMLSTGSWIAGLLFAALGLSYVLNVKQEYVRATIVQKLRKIPNLSEEALQAKILEVVHVEQRTPRDALQRYALAARIERELGEALPKAVSRVGIIVVYLLCLLLPLLIWIWGLRASNLS